MKVLRESSLGPSGRSAGGMVTKLMKEDCAFARSDVLVVHPRPHGDSCLTAIARVAEMSRGKTSFLVAEASLEGKRYWNLVRKHIGCHRYFIHIEVALPLTKRRYQRVSKRSPKKRERREKKIASKCTIRYI